MGLFEDFFRFESLVCDLYFFLGDRLFYVSFVVVGIEVFWLGLEDEKIGFF